MDQRGNDSELLLLFLLLHSLSEEDDPRIGEMLYDRLRHRLIRSELFDPEIDRLLRRRFHYPSESRKRRLSEAREVSISVLEGFRESFENSTSKRIDALETLIKKSHNITEEMSSNLKAHSNELTIYKRDAQDYFWLLGAGVDIKKVKLIRYVPVRAYISDPVPKQFALKNLVNSIEKLLTEFGFKKSDEFPEESGSWWKKLVLKTKEIMTQKEVSDRLKKVERAAEIAYLDKPQAEANQCQAQAASALITSLRDTNNACIQVGSLLVVKATGNNSNNKGSSIIARTLTPMELKHLEENQAILRKPEEILDLLQNIQKKRLTNT